jgi:hypothetical protein
MPILKLLFRLSITSLLASSLFGCAALNSDNLNDIFATDGVKAKRLNERVEKFHQALYWSSAQEAAMYIDKSQRREILRTLIGEKQKQKLVDLSVDFVDLQSDGETALIDVRVRYYPIPHYVIITRVDQETWKFDRFGGGWFLTDREIGEELNKDSFQLH